MVIENLHAGYVKSSDRIPSWWHGEPKMKQVRMISKVDIKKKGKLSNLNYPKYFLFFSQT